MAKIKPFRAVRPREEWAAEIAALPYDVYNREEAQDKVDQNPNSFLTVDRAETTMTGQDDIYAPEVYEKARKNLERYLNEEMMLREEEPVYFLYELTMDGRSQTGLVACASVDEYDQGKIKKHELTREEKEIDRIHHVDVLNANTGPIFLTYKDQDAVEALTHEAKAEKPIYDFTAEDGVTHRIWRVADPEQVEAFIQAVEDVDALYIADGHHRCASAVKVAKKRRAENPNYTGEEEFNSFLSVLFPAGELKILPYNRVVKDLNGLTAQEFLDKVEESFDLTISDQPVSPSKKGEIGLYLDGQWYDLNIKREKLQDDPVGKLDVSVLYDNILAPVLGIGDPRIDKRIDFVGGIRGLKELERRCATDMRAAFSMYPTAIEELIDIADAGLLMPPKSTWFEPKLRSGLFIHELG